MATIDKWFFFFFFVLLLLFLHILGFVGIGVIHTIFIFRFELFNDFSQKVSPSVLEEMALIVLDQDSERDNQVQVRIPFTVESAVAMKNFRTLFWDYYSQDFG